jgi:hypothetical protein
MYSRMGSTHEISDAAVLFKLSPGELSHVFPCSFLGNVCSAADNLPP